MCEAGNPSTHFPGYRVYQAFGAITGREVKQGAILPLKGLSPKRPVGIWLSIRRRIIVALKKHWELLLAFPIVLQFLHFLSHFLRDYLIAKLLDWAYEQMGPFGGWLLIYPFAGFTVGLCISLLALVVLVIMEWSIKEISPIVDPHLRHYKTERVSTVWAVLFSAIVVCVVAALAYGAYSYYQFKSTPEIIIRGYQVVLFDPDRPPFVNMTFKNIGGEGKLAGYYFTSLPAVTTDPKEVRKELDSKRGKLVADGRAESFYIKPMEEKWFTIIGRPLTSEEAIALKNGKMYFYFSGTIITTGKSSHNYDFCDYVLGNKPNVIFQCPEL